MKNLNVNKETVVRLQDEDMANLVGAAGDIKVTNTVVNSQEKALAQNQLEEGFHSCCQKSCR